MNLYEMQKVVNWVKTFDDAKTASLALGVVSGISNDSDGYFYDTDENNNTVGRHVGELNDVAYGYRLSVHPPMCPEEMVYKHPVQTCPTPAALALMDALDIQYEVYHGTLDTSYIGYPLDELEERLQYVEDMIHAKLHLGVHHDLDNFHGKSKYTEVWSITRQLPNWSALNL